MFKIIRIPPTEELEKWREKFSSKLVSQLELDLAEIDVEVV